MSGVLISYKDRVTTFWYATPRKKEARAIIADHNHHFHFPNEVMVAVWVDEWVHGENGEDVPKSQEPIELPKVG